MGWKKMLAVATVAACAATVGGAAELKIATVDLDKVFTAHPKTQAAEGELKKAEDAVQEEMDKIVAEGRALQEEVAKLREAAKNPLLTEDARLQKRDEAETKLTELQEFELRGGLGDGRDLKSVGEGERVERGGRRVVKTEAVNHFAAAGGYDLVLDKSGLTMNAVPLVAYSSPALDVTDKLIAYLQATAKTAAAAAEAPAAGE